MSTLDAIYHIHRILKFNGQGGNTKELLGQYKRRELELLMSLRNTLKEPDAEPVVIRLRRYVEYYKPERSSTLVPYLVAAISKKSLEAILTHLYQQLGPEPSPPCPIKRPILEQRRLVEFFNYYDPSKISMISAILPDKPRTELYYTNMWNHLETKYGPAAVYYSKYAIHHCNREKRKLIQYFGYYKPDELCPISKYFPSNPSKHSIRIMWAELETKFGPKSNMNKSNE